MILLFPDLDTLRVALTSGIVPAEVTLAPAAVSFDDQGKIYVEPTANLTKAVAKNLDRIGVKGSKRHASDAPQEVTCWPQLLPVTRDTAAPQLSNQAPVLFELERAEDLPVLVSEMLRLGNDRQGFRWFAAPDDTENKRVLLRVIGPPYYTLLRALDSGTAGGGGVRAYLERAPRVWVEVGHSLPLAQQLRVADKQLLLVRAPRDWVYLDDTPFQDVYDIMQFKLPAGPVGWTEAKAPKKMTVPLRLAPSTTTDTPELWVLRDNAVEQLDALVRDSDDRLLQRLMFAVATDAQGRRTVVLRVRPSKLTAPVLTLDNALPFKPYWKLPNLFLPVGKRLHPTLRRDAVRKLLADDADQVVWLYPDEAATGFTPESVPDAAFRSLEDWVDYVIEAEQQPLAAWIEATRFDFDHFVCKDGPKTKPDKGDKEPKGKEDEDAKAPKGVGPTKPTAKGKQPVAKPATQTDYLPPAEEVRKPTEWEIRAKELEAQFVAIEGPLDAPERQALWPELAAAYSGAKRPLDAAVCWLDALWDADPMPQPWLAAWARTELPDADKTVRADEFDRLLSHTGGGLEESRRVVAAFLWLASQQPVPGWLMHRLPALQKYLETHDAALPVRAVWLAGYRLAQLSGADVLGLARVRDRLLKRLLDSGGLQAERDLPGFLRFFGMKDSERMRVVRDKAMELHGVVRKWLDDSATAQKNDHLKANQPIVDLLFAFAVARLDESTQAKKLLEEARKVMEGPVPNGGNAQTDQAVTAAVVKTFLFAAFRYRIEQVLAGKANTGQMAPEVLDRLEDIAKKGGSGPVNNPYKLAKYVVDRMREQSQIMEPQEKPDPYADWTKHGDPMKKELAELHSVRDPNKLADRIRKLHKEGVTGKPLKEVQFYVLHEGLPLAATRVNEAFTVELLAHVPAALSGGTGAATETPDLHKKQGELLSRALYHAGHFNREDVVKKLVDDFTNLVHSKPEDTRYKLINVVARQCLRNLKKLGLMSEIDRFLTKLHNEVLRGASAAELKKKYAAKPDAWAAVLQTLLNLAGGWMHLGLHDRAAPILQEARNELLGSNAMAFQPRDYTELARAYVTALGQGGSPDNCLAGMIELFRKMSPSKITNTWTTAQYYSRFHLNLVEDVILALVSDESALGASGRKWLDDDEYLVRRRIHADMKRNLDTNHL